MDWEAGSFFICPMHRPFSCGIHVIARRLRIMQNGLSGEANGLGGRSNGVGPVAKPVDLTAKTGAVQIATSKSGIRDRANRPTPCW